QLSAHVERGGCDALRRRGTSRLQCAVGPSAPAADASHKHLARTAALVPSGGNSPHLFTPDARTAPPELPQDHVHPAVQPDVEAGVVDLVRRVLDVLGGEAPDRLGVDELTGPMLTHVPKLLSGT